MDDIALTISGVPVAKGRPRALARIVKGGGIARAIVQLITPPETRKAEDRIQRIGRSYMGDRPPFAGPVRMQIVAVYEPPKSWTKRLTAALAHGVIYHTGKPDTDNLAKLVGDALNGIAFQDDAQVAELIVRKRYGSPARTAITIAPLASTAATPADERRGWSIRPAAAASAPVLDASPRLPL